MSRNNHIVGQNGTNYGSVSQTFVREQQIDGQLEDGISTPKKNDP